MNTKHTPAPWVAIKGDRGYIITNEDSSYDIAIVRNVAQRFDNEANARLIAAAPELLKNQISAYYLLADFGNQWDGRHTPKGQKLLCDMCYSIANALGVTAEFVQNGGALTTGEQAWPTLIY